MAGVSPVNGVQPMKEYLVSVRPAERHLTASLFLPTSWTSFLTTWVARQACRRWAVVTTRPGRARQAVKEIAADLVKLLFGSPGIARSLLCHRLPLWQRGWKNPSYNETPRPAHRQPKGEGRHGEIPPMDRLISVTSSSAKPGHTCRIQGGTGRQTDRRARTHDPARAQHYETFGEQPLAS